MEITWNICPNIGSVILKNCCTLEAPSNFALSYNSAGIFCIAARNSTIKYPTCPQVFKRIMIHFALVTFPSHSIGLFISPRFIKMPLMIPLCDENMKKKITPMIAVLVIFGRKMIVLKKFFPFILPFTRIASNSERGIWITYAIKVN